MGYGGGGRKKSKSITAIINWFEKADEAVVDEEGDAYNFEEQKLSAILFLQHEKV